MSEQSTALDRPLAATPVPVMNEKEIEQTWRIAKALAASNFFKDARQAEAAFAKILLGRDLGLSPTESMQALHVFDGKVEASADFHATRVKRTPGYDYSVSFTTEADPDDEGAEITTCEVMFFREDVGEIGTSIFSTKDAERAGLVNKDVWKKYPRNMCFARAISNGVAWYCPEVMGAVRVYSEGEIEDLTDAATTPSTEQQDEMMNALAVAYDSDLCTAILGVYDRAKALGHANLSDAGTWDLRLRGQDEATAREAVAEAQAELDRFEAERAEPPVAEEVPEAEEAPAEAWVGERAQALRDEANDLLDKAVAAREAGDESGAAALEADAETARDEAERLDPSQPTLDGEGLG